MAGLLDRFFGKKTSSADLAKDRLKFVLVHDRVALSPTTMESLKNEIVQVISHYVEIDPEQVRFTIAQEGREQRLMADIPIKANGKRRR
jgi:cell division topological specificity factor